MSYMLLIVVVVRPLQRNMFHTLYIKINPYDISICIFIPTLLFINITTI